MVPGGGDGRQTAFEAFVNKYIFPGGEQIGSIRVGPGNHADMMGKASNAELEDSRGFLYSPIEWMP